MWSSPGTMRTLWDFTVYMDTDTVAWESAPRPPRGVEGRWAWRYFVVLTYTLRTVHQMLSLTFSSSARGGVAAGVTFELPDGRYVRFLLSPCKIRRF